MRGKIFAGLAIALAACAPLRAAVVINEVQYDDGGSGPDDREFVELFNDSDAVVDISGWTLGGHDGALNQNNPQATLPGLVGSGTTVIGPRGYYVIGAASVPDVNLTVSADFLENDGETLELYNGPFDVGTLQDGLAYEGFNGATGALSHGVLSALMLAQVNGQPVWGIHAPPDASGGLTTVTLGRYVDGRDTNNSGRDFGMLKPTPGKPNSTATMTNYVAPNPDAFADGAALPDHTGSFVGLRAMTPGSVSPTLNPNAIPPLPGYAKALVAWDGAGGGNAVVSNAIFAGGAQRFDISAYLDTANLPGSTTPGGVPFQSSEYTYYGLAGSIDANVGGSGSNYSNISGLVESNNNSAVGATGVAWYYEKVGTGASEKLYLIDAGDGGNMNTRPANATPDEWTVLTTIDLSGVASGWHRLSIEIDALGNGLARYDDQVINFTTAAGLYGSFYVGYRENASSGATSVPSFLRPPTFNQFLGEEVEIADADFNNDLVVDGADFLIWQAYCGGAGSPATGDATGDGQVTGADFDQWAAKFGGPPAVAASVTAPEPETFIAALMALSAGLARRRRISVQ